MDELLRLIKAAYDLADAYWRAKGTDAARTFLKRNGGRLSTVHRTMTTMTAELREARR